MTIAWNAPAHWAATYCGMNPSFCVFHSLGGRAPVANQPRNPANHMGSTICQWIQIDALHKNQLYSWVVGRIWNVWNCLLPLQKWNHPFLGSGRKQLPTSGASEAVWKLYQFSENLTFSRISQHDASFDLGVRLERITKSPEPGQHQIAVSLKCVKLGPSHIWPLPSSFLLLFGIPTIRDLGHQESSRVIEGHQRWLPKMFAPALQRWWSEQPTTSRKASRNSGVVRARSRRSVTDVVKSLMASWWRNVSRRKGPTCLNIMGDRLL